MGALRIALNHSTSSLAWASFELGLYSATGTLSQAYGISHITATQAGFLIQLTAVCTPCIAYLAGFPVPRRTWVACTLALAGTIVIAVDGLTSMGGASGADVTSAAAAAAAARDVQEQLSGSAAVLVAAFSYSIATFRISCLAPSALPRTCVLHDLYLPEGRHCP
jgi:drug/metabolite transporter (DMT)-like permease